MIITPISKQSAALDFAELAEQWVRVGMPGVLQAEPNGTASVGVAGMRVVYEAAAR